MFNSKKFVFAILFIIFGSAATASWLPLTSDSKINVVLGAALSNSNTALVTTSGFPNYKGRRLYCFGSAAKQPGSIQFAFYNLRINATNGANGTSETVGFNSVPITKAYVNLLNNATSLTPIGTGAIVTTGGSRSFTIPANANEFLTDALTPRSFGLSVFPPSSCLDYRHLITGLTNGVVIFSSPTTIDQQGWRSPSPGIDDIDTTGLMTCSGGCGGTTIFMPTMVVGPNPSAAFKSYAMFGDSIMFRQNSVSNKINATLGAGYVSQGAFDAGVPNVKAAIGGRSYGGIVNSPITQRILFSRTNRTYFSLGTNDISNADSLATMTANLTSLAAKARSYGHSKIGASTVIPRNTEGTNNTTNLWAGTNLSVMVPYITQAVTPSAGYGFGAGETRDQWNGTILPNLLSNSTINFIVDIDSVSHDLTTTWKWAVPAFTTTLAAQANVGSNPISLVASPPLYTNLVFEPGGANLDPGTSTQGGPVPYSVTGAGPFSATLSYSATYSGSSTSPTPTKIHLSGTAVVGTNTTDYTHPDTLLHDSMSTLATTAFTDN